MRTHVPRPRIDRSDQSGSPDETLATGRSAYSQAQQSAEIKGLTPHTDETLEQCRELQRHAGQLADQQLKQRVRRRMDRVVVLALATVGLWLATLIVLLAKL